MRKAPLIVLLGILLLQVMVLTVSAASHTYSASPGVAIPDGNGDPSYCNLPDPRSIISTISVPDSFTISDLNVMLDISHTYVGDLSVTLTSPSSTTVTLIDRVGRETSSCGSETDNINTTLDDESTNGPVKNANPPTGSSYTPENPLSAFDGQNASGTWTLTVMDNMQIDTGILNSWSLIVEAMPDGDSDGVPDATDNCPSDANPGQEDGDGDSIGDACDTTPSGDNDSDGIDNALDHCPARGDEGYGVGPNGCPPRVWVRPDERVNWHHGDLSTVVYSQGEGAVVYCYVNGSTWLGLHITPDDVADADPNQPQNIPVLEYDQDGCHAAFYILRDSNEYQINYWTFEGKLYELISDTLDFANPTMRYFDPNE